MQQKEIHHFLYEFFKANHCPILSRSDHYLIVQLTVEMDKKIMNRPFYWQYIESTGEQASPAQLTFITNYHKSAEGISGESIHFGSPRLAQLFQVTKEIGSFIQMYEKPAQVGTSEQILTPWLCINYKISYESHQVKEEIFSLGMNLMTGDLYKQFQESLFEKNLQETVPAKSFCLPAIIAPKNAIERLDHFIENYILQGEHPWAVKAKKMLEKEMLILNYFYEGIEEKPACYRREKESLESLYEPRIRIEVINGGIFYLNRR